MFDKVKDWLSWGKLGWTAVTAMLTFTAHTVGQCQSAASVIPRIEKLETSSREQETTLARMDGYVRGIAEKLGARPLPPEAE